MRASDELRPSCWRSREALELTRESESLAGEDDITAQIPWREARARILARRGEMADAEKFAREAVAIAERTDWLNMQGYAQLATDWNAPRNGHPDRPTQPVLHVMG
jgi:hypothetical protein